MKIATVLTLILTTCVLAAAPSDSLKAPADVMNNFHIQVKEARTLDSLAREAAVQSHKADSASHDLLVQAQAVYNSAVRQVYRTLKLDPSDTLKPDGTILRAKKVK